MEAFNLKAAIEFALDNTAAAKEALADMPPRDLGELDACTLHNRALLHMADDPGEGFRTLSFLVANPPFPPETFRNLLLLYITPPHAMHDVAADTIAQYPELAQRHLPRELLAFLDAVNLRAAAPDEAHAQLEQLGKQYIERMRLLAKMIQVRAAGCAVESHPCSHDIRTARRRRRWCSGREDGVRLGGAVEEDSGVRCRAGGLRAHPHGAGARVLAARPLQRRAARAAPEQGVCVGARDVEAQRGAHALHDGEPPYCHVLAARACRKYLVQGTCTR